MNLRILLLAILSATALPTMATSGVTPVPGEVGFTTHAMPGAKTRELVLKELTEWNRNPVTPDGWKEVSGERGWVYVGTPQTAASKPVAVKKAETPGQRDAGTGIDGALKR